MTDEIPDGFMPWRGGENPVPGKRVQIYMAKVFAFDSTRVAHPADSLRWSHFPENPVGDILAYRVVE